MNLEQSFVQSFYPFSFETFDSFFKCLKRFEKAFGICYKVSTANKLGEGTKNAKSLKYEFIKLVCTNHEPSWISGAIAVRFRPICQSYVELVVSENRLKIKSYDMHHDALRILSSGIEDRGTLGFPQDQNEFDNCGLTGFNLSSKFQDFFKNNEFGSFGELTDKLRKFEHATGALYVKLNSKRFPEGHPLRETMIYNNIKYTCYHYGTRASSATQRTKQRTSKLGCNSQICARYSHGRLRVTSYDMHHNHPVTVESAQLYPRNRRLNKHKFGKVCTKTDLKNMRSRLKRMSCEAKCYSKRTEQLEEVLGDMTEVAGSSNEVLFARNLSALKTVLGAWEEGKALSVTLIEKGDEFDGTSKVKGNAAPYQCDFPGEGTDVLVGYSSSSPFLIQHDNHE